MKLDLVVSLHVNDAFLIRLLEILKILAALAALLA
ncbi:putative membrane protein (plasmid) [Vibrio vulnificus]|nr:putative membrane protein [Vibrio vulnificus]